MKIATCNVNGIRAALKKGLVDWLNEENPDVVCFQEVKATSEQIDASIFEELGYTAYWHSAEKKGYSGVMTLSKKEADNVAVGMGMDKYDSEGRVLRTDIDGISIYNCYFPSGSSGDERHAFKMEFLHDFGPWMKEQSEKNPNPKVVVGDYNIVYLDIDIHNPTRRDKPSGFKPEERQWIKEWFDNDFKDSYRVLHPEDIQFSWWSFRAGSRQRNKGWRIDYMSVSNDLEDKVTRVEHFKDVLISDHCPIVLELK